MVKVREGRRHGGADQRMRELLRQRHRLQPGQDDDFFVRNLSEILQAQEASSKVMSLLLAAVASVSLLVGGIGIMNIMLVSVTERTREIGLRMAVGARARDILTQFLVEAVTLSLIGGAIGILLGVGGAMAIAELAGWRTELSGSSIVLAAGFAGAVGVFFGYYPARKASRLLPDRSIALRVSGQIAMAEEVELKLALAEGHQARFLRHPLLKQALRRHAETLDNIYYDTEDLSLRRRGIALRLRRKGHLWLQTVKLAGNSAAGLSQPARVGSALRRPLRFFRH
jgi:hypothetical protein